MKKKIFILLAFSLSAHSELPPRVSRPAPPAQQGGDVQKILNRHLIARGVDLELFYGKIFAAALRLSGRDINRASSFSLPLSMRVSSVPSSTSRESYCRRQIQKCKLASGWAPKNDIINFWQPQERYWQEQLKKEQLKKEQLKKEQLKKERRA